MIEIESESESKPQNSKVDLNASNSKQLTSPNDSLRTIEVLNISRSTPKQENIQNLKTKQALVHHSRRFMVTTRSVPWKPLQYPESVEPVKPKGSLTAIQMLAYQHDVAMHKHRLRHKEICANRNYKYKDKSPWITFDTTFLRQRQREMEVQGAPFLAGEYVRPKIETTFKPFVFPSSTRAVVKRVRTDSLSLPSDLVNPVKMKKEILLDQGSDENYDAGTFEMFSPQITSGIFSPTIEDVHYKTGDNRVQEKHEVLNKEFTNLVKKRQS